MPIFKFELDALVRIDCSTETGRVVARAQFARKESQYLVRYLAGDGRAVEAWWDESALVDDLD